MAQAIESVQHLSLRERMLRAGYVIAPSHQYGCRRILKCGANLGHYSAKSMWREFFGITFGGDA